MKYFIKDNTPCKCGRIASSRHCPVCGSVNIYAVTRNSVIVGDIHYRGYRCRRCGENFNQLTECEAERAKATQAEIIQGLAVNSQQAINFPDSFAALAQAKAKLHKGI